MCSVQMSDDRKSVCWCADQVLDLAPGGSNGRAYGGECNISGLSFTPSGQRLYIGLEGATEQEGIAAFDVKMLSRLTFAAGQLN